MTPDAQAALEWLGEHQLPNGSFEIASKPIQQKPTVSANLSLHATLLDILIQSHVSDIDHIAEPLAQYLAGVLLGDDFTNKLLNVDTRAVFHVLAALHERDADLIPPAAIAACIQFLTVHEIALGGPYGNTLAKNTSADKDTNLSIARFLYQLAGPFPALLTYVTSTNDSYYFASDWAARLQDELLLCSTNPKTSLSSTNYSGDLGDIEYFYRDYYATGMPMYGMPAITAARTLCSYAASTPDASLSVSVDQNSVLNHVHTVLPAWINDDIVLRVVAADTHNEIGLFAIRFAAAIKDKSPTSRALELLGAANVLNWAAYTIYDDILDDEAGSDPLSAANTMLRGAVRLFKAAVQKADFAKIVEAHFDAVDEANAWEREHCRFLVTSKTIRIGPLPVYDDPRHLYDRSLTHRLPMMGTLAAIGLPATNPSVVVLARAFTQYLTIRQLNDDLHDWKEDVYAGRISYVVTRLFVDAHISIGKHALDKLLPKLEKAFLYKTLPFVANEILMTANQAHASIRSVRFIEASNILSELISGYEQTTRELLLAYQNGLALLDAFPA